MNAEQGPGRPLAAALAAYQPRARRCPCGAEYTGISRLCGVCTPVELARQTEVEQGAERRRAVMDEERRLAWAHLPSGTDKRLSTLRPRSEVRGLSEAVGAVLAWLEGEGPPWVVLTGSWGVGKSHLAEGAVRALVERGERARWQPVVDLLATMRRMIGAGGDPEGFLAQVAATPWLALDDLGRERATDWAQDALFRLVQERQNPPRRTLVTTNETKESLGDHVGGAIASRVFDHSLARVVVLQGPDWR